MKLLLKIFSFISYLFGLYYLYMLILSLATQWGLFFPLQELPLQVLVYLYYGLFVVMAGITLLKNDRYYLFSISFLLMIIWILFFPVFFVPSVPALVMFIFFQIREHPVRNYMAFLVIAYITLGFTPVWGYVLLMLAWGVVAQTMIRTQKRGI